MEEKKGILEFWLEDLKKYGCPKEGCQVDGNILEELCTENKYDKVLQCPNCKEIFYGVGDPNKNEHLSTVHPYPVLCSYRATSIK